MRKNIAFIAVIIFSLNFYCGNNPKTFEIGENDFLLNGRPIVLRSGELHYSRIPQEYWRHRLQMCKAMGLNSVCAYMFWNYHEPDEGNFNFTGMADVAEFCRLAQEEGLLVILRPGPYSCAEWDWGGFPYWLVKDENMTFRTQYPGYLEACKRYIMRVGQELAPLQISTGGPIIMVQIENEYGSYGSDKEYIGILRDYWREAGFNVPFFMCDGPQQLINDWRDDIFTVVNFGGNPARSFKALRTIQEKGPLMCGEYYPAWFDHWGKPHHTKDVAKLLPDLEYMLENRASFSLYMVHGGTSFGFTSGANYSDRYQPQTTSYDYDAPISEAGWATPKYQTLRNLFSQYLNPEESLPDIPGQKPVIAIPEIVFQETAPLFEQLREPIITEHPGSFEMYGQALGCVLYKTIIPAGAAGTLKFKSLNDYAQIFMGGEKIANFDRRANKGKWVTGFNDLGQNIIKSIDQNEYSVHIPVSKRGNDIELEIFVEAMGHINYGAVIDMDRKGIIGKVIFESAGVSQELINWRAYLLPLNEVQLSELSYKKDKAVTPSFYRAGFSLKQTGDTFLDMRTWGKGVVWINGHNLGRYWRIGPSQTLYVPAPWLKKGVNEIVILEFLQTEIASVQGLSEPILDQPGK